MGTEAAPFRHAGAGMRGSALIAGVFWNFLGHGWGALLAFVATPYIISGLGDSLYGVYALAGFVLSYFAFLEFGLGAAATKYISQHLAEGKTGEVVSAFWACLLWFAAAVVLCLLLVGGLARPLVAGPLRIPVELRPAAETALRLSAVSFSFSLCTSLTVGTLRSLGRFSALNLTVLAIGTAQTALTLGILWAGYSLIGVMVVLCVAHAALFGWQFALCLRVFPPLRSPRIRRAAMRRLVRYGSVLSVASVTGPLLMHLEKLFLTRFTSVGLLTYYAVPFSLVDRLGVIPSAFGGVLFPSYSYHSVNGRDVNQRLHHQGTLYILLTYGFVASFLVILGHSLLAAWLGDTFADTSAPVLSLLAIAGLLNAAARPAVTALQGIGKPNIPVLFQLAELVLYVPLAFWLVKGHGLPGAAWAWSIRTGLDALLLHAASAAALGQPAASYWTLARAAAGPITLCSAGFALVRALGYPLTNPLSLSAVAGVAVLYGWYVWKAVLDDHGRASILAALRHSPRCPRGAEAASIVAACRRDPGEADR